MSKVPNTISDQQYADLQRRAQAAQADVVSRQAVRRLQDSIAQRGKAQQS